MRTRGWTHGLAIGLAVFAVAQPEGALAKSSMTQVCKDHVHEGFAESKTYDRAFIGAFQTWEAAVIAHDGASWANIDRSAPVTCEKLSQGGADGWRCRVVYRPCRMVPSDLPATAPMPEVKVTP